MTTNNATLHKLWTKALSAHQNNHLDSAQGLYTSVLKINPHHYQSLHNLGLVLIAKEDAEAAKGYLIKAIDINPVDDECLYHLGEAYRLNNEIEHAINYYQKAIQINDRVCDYYFSLGDALYSKKKYPESVHSYSQAIKLNGQDYLIYYHLANALIQMNQISQANEVLHVCIQLNGNYYPAHQLLAQNLLKDNRIHQALHYFEKCVSLQPSRVDYQLSLANCLIRLERHDFAKNILVKLFDTQKITNNQHHSDLIFSKILFSYALCLESEGEFDLAIEVHRHCWKINPLLTESFYHMVTNGNYVVNRMDIESAQEEISNNRLTDEKKSHLYFALAKCEDKAKKYCDAFNFYKKGNDIKFQSSPFDANRHADYIKTIAKTFDRNFFTQRQDYGLPIENLIFIVGMPRSGSTLTEQILASHHQVIAKGESYAMSSLIKEAANGKRNYMPQISQTMSKDLSQQLAQQYLKYHDINPLSSMTYVDKMLGNFMRLGFIALLFPKAKIIHCERNPIDTCLSCYQQNFAHGLRFTNNLESLGFFYRNYQWLMNHWNNTLPLPIYNIQYEDLINETEQSINGLLNFCDVPWDVNCLAFHKNKRNVGSASFWQSKQPIYKTAIAKHQPYKAHLTPLINALNEPIDSSDTF